VGECREATTRDPFDSFALRAQSLRANLLEAAKDPFESFPLVTPSGQAFNRERWGLRLPPSFASGNVAIENPRITREMVDRQADELGKPQN